MKIRRATIDDAQDIFNWRNDPKTRQMSLEKQEVTLDTHMSWLNKALEDNNICIFIAQERNHKIAVVRFNRKSDTLVVSINLNPDHRKQGLAAGVLNNSIEKISSFWKFNEIEAEIRPENTASLRLFEKCGFRKKDVSNNILIYSKS